MCKFTLYSILIVVGLCYNSIYAQVKFNISGNSQIFYSSDWNERPNNDFSVKASLEIPISKKHKDFSIVPHFRYQKDDLFYEYLSYNHNNTRFFIFNDAYYEYGQFKDVRFTMDKYLFGLNIQRRIIDQLYLSLGSGVSMNVYNDLQGQSSSYFHYYDIDLSAYELPSDMNVYYSINLQYKFQVFPKLDIIFGGEFIKHQKIDIKDLNILGLKQHSFHFDIGLGYRF
jgi:hypothetical protein